MKPHQDRDFRTKTVGEQSNNATLLSEMRGFSMERTSVQSPEERAGPLCSRTRRKAVCLEHRDEQEKRGQRF